VGNFSVNLTRSGIIDASGSVKVSCYSNQAKQESAVAEKSQEYQSSATGGNFNSRPTHSKFRVHPASWAQNAPPAKQVKKINHQPSPADLLHHN
jgi:hypothetical protein